VTLTAEQLQPLLAAWMPEQRWFAGKGREFAITGRELAVVGAGPPEFSIWLADVQFSNGGTETYQVPLVLRDEPVSSLEHVLLGTVTDGSQVHWVYDALFDRETTQAFLFGIAQQSVIGALRFERFVEPDALPIGSESLVLTGEQSNTSLVYGQQAILKVFRRLEHGLNPDIEVQTALAKFGGRHVAQLLGAISADVGGESVSLAMLQEFMTTATDGWELSKTSVRDLMAEADLHAEEAGGDFASESFRLGVAVAEVHYDLAAAFGTAELLADDRHMRARDMHARLDLALSIVPELVPMEAGLRQAFEDFAQANTALITQRVHGDLHLGQALRTVHRWVLLDFEGEPVSTMAQRRAFDQLEYRAIEWAERNRDAFCDGYASGAGYDPRDDMAAIRGFEADKAVYEAVYEARNRPRWLIVPLTSLTRLVRTGVHPVPEKGLS
jgi:maltokinase